MNRFLFLFLIVPLWLVAEVPFVLFTVPKSGTYLAKRVLEELSGKKGEFLYMPGWDFDKASREAYDEGTFYFYHYREWKHLANQMQLFKKKKLFVNVRDPRDVCISSAYFFSKELDALIGKEASFEERLAYVIQTPIMHDGLHDFFGPQMFYKNAFNLVEELHPMVIRFEDLVGPQGGGSLESQVHMIQEIGNRIGSFLTPEMAIEVGDRIYGNTLTFREGHIGSWKAHFNDTIKALFKESYLNFVLVKLGYESTPDW